MMSGSEWWRAIVGAVVGFLYGSILAYLSIFAIGGGHGTPIPFMLSSRRAGGVTAAWAQLSNIASRIKDVLGVDKLEAIANCGYFNGEHGWYRRDAAKPMTPASRQRILSISVTRLSIAAARPPLHARGGCAQSRARALEPNPQGGARADPAQQAVDHDRG